LNNQRISQEPPGVEESPDIAALNAAYGLAFRKATELDERVHAARREFSAAQNAAAEAAYEVRVARDAIDAYWRRTARGAK